MLARLILFLSGVVFIGVGGYYLIDPYGGASLVGIILSSPLAASDLRAVYGGLDLAVGDRVAYWYPAMGSSWWMTPPGFTRSCMVWNERRWFTTCSVVP